MANLTVIGDQATNGLALGGESPSSRSSWGDLLGVVASIGCAIHCAAMPFVIAFLPMLGLSFLADPYFHKVMVFVCTLIALAAFIPGWRRHRKWLPAGIAVVGLSFITTAAFALEDTCACCATPSEEEAKTEQVAASICTDENCEHCLSKQQAATETPAELSAAGTESPLSALVPWITPIGGLFLVSAHLINRRFACRCGCCPTDSPAK
ncbi:MAG: MerC domain-containing protein [Planctomycetota bacterium]